MEISFEHEGRSCRNWPIEEAKAANVPADVIAGAVAKLRRTEVAKECRRRIYAVASAEAQMNMAAAVGVISGKAASSRTDDEKAVLAGAAAAIEWVAAMRAAVSEVSEDPDADPADDAGWPEIPDAALEMIQNF